ncbi:MAG: hypothetical protein ACREQV_03775, partial [Candidatus Binatia bacterium]
MATLAGGCVDKLTPPAVIGQKSTFPEGSRPSVDTTRAKEGRDGAAQPAQQTPAMIVHIDPATDQILPAPPLPPTGHIPEPPLLQSAPASAPQFLEVPSPTPGGGVKVNLNRQFHQPLVATIDNNGRIKLRHRPAQHSGSATK